MASYNLFHRVLNLVLGTLITLAILLYSENVGAEEQVLTLKPATHYWKKSTPRVVVIVAALFSILVPVLVIAWICWWFCTHANPPDAAGLEPAVDPVVVEPSNAPRLDLQMIEFFPVHSFPINSSIGYGQVECEICLDEFVQGEDIRVLPSCRHIFHYRCIRSWFTSSGTGCPVCRHDYSGWEPEVGTLDIA